MKMNIFLFCLLISISTASYAQWIEINSPVANAIFDINFINDSTGFCIGQDGIIKSTDYGNTWNLINSSPSGYNIFFFNSSIGFATSGNAVFKSTDSGITWNQVSTFKNQILGGIYFTTSDIGYLITTVYSTGYIYKTVNGGSNWVETNSFTGIPTLQDITFVNADTGFVVGYAGKIIKTYDAGASWTLSQTPSETLLSVCFPTKTVGYAAGYSTFSGSEIIKTIDAGNSWQLLATGGTINTALRTVSFCSVDTGFAAGEGGRIITTVNGGVSWQNSISPVNETFWGSSFIKSDLGFVCGTNGTILKTITGGLTNIQYHDPPNIKLFPNPATNWISIESNNLVNKKVALSLRNLLGQEVKHENFQFSENYKLKLDHLESGVYLLSLTSDQEQVTVKIIVEK